MKFTTTIFNDSLGLPVRLKTVNDYGLLIGFEEAQYFYSDNLVMTMIFDQNELIVGITVHPINNYKPTLSFEDFLQKNPIVTYQVDCKNWAELKVQFHYFDIKLNENNLWQTKIHWEKHFIPSQNRYTKPAMINNRTRKYKYW